MTAHLRLNFLLTAVTVQSKKDSNKNGKGQQERLSQRESLHTDNIKKQGCELEALNQEFRNL